MNLCVIGNSHLTAIKVGWPPSPLAPTFFGIPGRGISTLAVEGRALVTNDDKSRKFLALTSGGLDRIEVNKFDAFLLVGASGGFGILSGIFMSHRVADNFEDGKYLISESCMRASAEAFASGGREARLFNLLRQLTEAPIFLMDGPLPTRQILSSKRGGGWRNLAPILRLKDVYDAHRAMVLAEGRGVAIPQPSRTIEGIVFTKDEYGIESCRLDDGRLHAEDGFHMNAAYGRAAVEAFLAILPVPQQTQRTLKYQ